MIDRLTTVGRAVRRSVPDPLLAVLGTLTVGLLVLRPDWYHRQNGLDPWFYTGQSLNLSDAIDQGTATHYFLGRWSIYLPELVVQAVTTPVAGYLAVRVLALVAIGIVLEIGRASCRERV